MYPDTRGRISTDSTGSSRPVNSSHSLTSFSTAVTTLTGSGGCSVTDAFLHPLTTSNTHKIPTLRKLFFINDRVEAISRLHIAFVTCQSRNWHDSEHVSINSLHLCK